MGRKLALLGIAVVAVVSCPAAGARVRLLDSHPAARPVAIALVGPSGAPMPAAWQRWADEAQVPTYPGRVQMDVGAEVAHEVCGFDGAGGAGVDLVLGCATRAAQSGLPEVVVAPSSDERGVLYHELGHVFDAYVMSGRWRVAFMRLWGLRPRGRMSWAQLWDGTGPASRDVRPREWFAEGYRMCATYGRWTTAEARGDTADARGYPAEDASGWRDTYRNGGSWVVESKVPPARVRWAIETQNRVCAMIDAAAG